MTALQDALALLEANRAPEAEQICRTRLEIEPRNPGARSVLALALAAQQRYPECIELWRELALDQPDEPTHPSNLGNALRAAGRCDQAIDCLRLARRRWPDDAELQYNLGLAEFAAGRFREACITLRAVWRRRPELVAAGVYLARCLAELGRRREAFELTRQAEPRLADQPALLNELGIVFIQLGDNDAGLAAFATASARDPSLHEAQINAADALERMNRIAEANDALERIGRHVERDPLARLVRARLRRRRGENESAIEELRALLAGDLHARLRIDVLFELGRLLDQRGNAESAYNTLEEANQRVLAFWREQRGPLAADASELAWLNERFEPDEIRNWSRPVLAPDPDAPIFVVGFPRSGSTLFEQILDAHPALQALEEKPAVEAMVTRLRDSHLGYPSGLSQLSARDILELRGIYWAEVARHLARRPHTRLVDKYPLNMSRLALIQRVFPQAKFVLLLRHPCDVCFSCFMQNFRITDGTIGFHTLQNTARIYAQVMHNWVAQVELFSPQYLVVRYEDLVRDLRTTVQRVVDFLGLELDDRMLDPAAHALSRGGRINTPSYSQVVRPVNTEAIERWRRYERHFEAVLPILEPWIERWGYSKR